jgi:hypothetical protein
MELRIDALGIVFESGVFNLSLSRSAIITLAVILVGLKARQLYLERTKNPQARLKSSKQV